MHILPEPIIQHKPPGSVVPFRRRHVAVNKHSPAFNKGVHPETRRRAKAHGLTARIMRRANESSHLEAAGRYFEACGWALAELEAGRKISGRKIYHRAGGKYETFAKFLKENRGLVSEKVIQALQTKQRPVKRPNRLQIKQQAACKAAPPEPSSPDKLSNEPRIRSLQERALKLGNSDGFPKLDSLRDVKNQRQLLEHELRKQLVAEQKAAEEKRHAASRFRLCTRAERHVIFWAKKSRPHERRNVSRFEEWKVQFKRQMAQQKWAIAQKEKKRCALM